VATPWGEFAAHTDEAEGILYCDLDLERVKKVRRELPLLQHRREDIYKLTVV